MKGILGVRLGIGAFIFSFALTLAGRAQVPYAGVTTLVLGLDVANGVIPAAPGSRVRVPPYERVTLVLPDSWTYPIQWRKDNQPIAGATGHTFAIPLATTADSGRYNVTGAPFPFIATGILLEVVPGGNVGNFSVRLELAPGAGIQIVGFVVSGTSPKNLLIRAVGPTLGVFGIAKPAARPRVRFYDSTGTQIGFTHPAIVVDMGAFFASVGAFLLSGGETSYDYGPFSRGAYTIQVADESGQGGTVLVEAYEFTTGPQPLVTPVVPPPGPGA